MNASSRSMSILLCLGALLLALGATRAPAAEPVQLAIKFREGQTLRYTYTETLTYSPPSKFVGAMGYTLEAKVDYTLKVGQVTDSGATVKLNFERVTVLKDGNQIADLTVFPKGADVVSTTIKSNGQTTFYKNIYLTMNKGGQLEFRISTGGGAIATGTTAAGSENPTMAADLDEGLGVIKIGVPPTRNVESPDHARLAEFKIDLTPRKLFEFLLLPTVPLAQGQTFSVPVKYLGQETLTYQGQADEGGFQGAQVKVDIEPWTESTDGAAGIQPVVRGAISYLIDSGKLARARGRIRAEILIPTVGPQVADIKMELIRK